MNLSEKAQANLRESGLTDETIEKMYVRMATVMDGIQGAESGYVIPYFVPDQGSFTYNIIPSPSGQFSRIRLLESSSRKIKYRQETGTGNHVYFPPFVDIAKWFDTSVPLFITEGEKKASAMCQADYLTCGFGGIDSWRSRRVQISSQQVQQLSPTSLSIRLSPEDALRVENQVADELMMIPLEDRRIYVVYDTELGKQTTKDSVQRAAFDLCIWLENNGADALQVVLPISHQQKKVAIDDFLLEYGPEGFDKVVRRARFPARPNIKSWILKRMDEPRRLRSNFVTVSRAVLASLDKRGRRYVDKLGSYYYFDKQRDVLHELPMSTNMGHTVTSFQRFLLAEYGIAGADRDLLSRIIQSFEAIEPIKKIERAYRGNAVVKDSVYYQLSDSKMARVNDKGIVQLRNGEEGILFQAGSTPVELVAPPKFDKPDDFGWLPAIRTTTLQPMGVMSLEETQALVATLFYISPWLWRWRGLMLPMELAIGEPGSGKSSLYQLRQGIFKGFASLNTPPKELKDWYASIANESGMWIGDNFGGRLQDELSNELARLITDPEPTFELRELFTTSGLAKRFVNCTFALTALYSPVTKPDLLQRSLTTEFAARQFDDRETDWLSENLKDRELWVAHHLDVLQRFFEATKTHTWGSKSVHRLVGFEGTMTCMADAIGLGKQVRTAFKKLPDVIYGQMAEADPVLEGIYCFVEELTRNKDRRRNGALPSVTAADIVEWVTEDDEFGRFRKIQTLSNTRSLGRYLQTHKNDVYRSTGLKATDRKRKGIAVYEVTTPPVRASLDP